MLSIVKEIFVKILIALVLAILLAWATGGTFSLTLRYFAAIQLLASIGFCAAAIARKPASNVMLSNWDLALIFSLLAGCAHIAAGFVSS